MPDANTALTAWDPNSGAALPAYLADAMGELGTNIPDRQNVPSLSYKGGVWAIVKDGNDTKLQAKNSDGDMVPVPVMRVVVLNFNPDRGRAYYPGNYNPAQAAQPDCWSADGKTPDDSSKHKQSSLCNGCPQSIKGSKVQDGKEMVACGSHRMLAVAPAFEIDSDPLRLKIAVTSDYDKDIVEHGWFAFRQYSDYLKSRGITHTGLVVTKIKFDPNPAYPKLLFALDRLLSPEEVAKAKAALANPKVAELLAEKWSAAGTQGTPTDDGDIKPWGLEGAYADGWIAHPDSAGWSYKGQEVLENAVLAARYPEPAPPALPAAAKEEPKAAAPSVPPVNLSAPVTSTAWSPLAAAAADGWAPHPETAGYCYKGQVVLTTDDLAKQFPEPVAEEAVPAVPAAPSEPPAGTPLTPRELATNDGWVQHPDSPPHGYKGAEVLEWGAIEAKYAGNAVAAPAAPATAGPAAATMGSGSTSPSSATIAGGVIPADVQGLLDKWAG